MSYYQQQPNQGFVAYPNYNNNPPIIEVWVDGCCFNNGQPNARAGIGGFFGQNSPLNFSERLDGVRQSNTVAEIRAAERALQIAKHYGYTHVRVYTGSKFLVESVEQWMGNWLSNGWRKQDGSPVENREDFERLNYVRQGMATGFVHVAQQGHYGNEAAHQFAQAGAQKQG